MNEQNICEWVECKNKKLLLCVSCGREIDKELRDSTGKIVINDLCQMCVEGSAYPSEE